MEDNKKCNIPFRDISNSIEEIAKAFGYIDSKNTKNAGLRRFTPNRGYLAFINPDQPDDGVYNGLSFVVFPIGYKENKNNEDESEFICVVAIGIGKGDVGGDEELANLPYLRRCFLRLTAGGQENYENHIFIKNSFADVTTESVDLFKELYQIKTDNQSEKESDETDNGETKFHIDLSFIEAYKNLLPAARIVKFKQKDCVTDLLKLSAQKNASNSFKIIVSWLAQYAKIRNWDYRGDRLSAKNKAIDFTKSSTDINSEIELKEVYKLLKDHHFVVLQGAPGVGKTRMANLIGTNYYKDNKNYKLNEDDVISFDDLFFVQFHAETTYADFIGGIRPKLGVKKDHLEYEYIEGTLTEAIKTALSEENKKYLLVIDEINRANLANVLGPVFYLFERTKEKRKGKIKLEIKLDNDDNHEKIEENESNPFIKLASMPDNLYVIATMNTADRSLAVVDFALRRRFAWYTLHAREIEDHELDQKEYFHRNAFKEIELLFEKYASDEELNLQPGNGYFILKKKDVANPSDQNTNDEVDEYKNEMGDRLTYEIMPLMKEYFTEGLLIKAQDEFANYYYKMTKKYMYW